MITKWPLPRIEIRALSSIKENRPAALLTSTSIWQKVSASISLPLVLQAEPYHADIDFLNGLADELPEEVEVVYGIGGGLVADAAKYIAFKNKIPAVVIPSALSVDGLFTAIVAVREGGSVDYVTTGPAESMIIDWDVITEAPARVRGAAIIELLTIVIGLKDWNYAAERNKNTRDTRYMQWAASVAAGIAQQAFKIAEGVGAGRVDALNNLLDLICMEVQLTNQLGHNRPQEGSEQHFAYAIEPKITRLRGRGVPYADLVGPGLLIAGVLHGQDITAIRDTLTSAGIRLNQLSPEDMIDTLKELKQFVVEHDLPYTILNDTDISTERAREILKQAGL